MNRIVLAIVFSLIYFSTSYCAAGEGLIFGYGFSNVKGVTSTAENMGLSAPNTDEIFGEIRPFVVANSFLRIGGMLSVGYSRIKGAPDTTILNLGEAGTGFGDIRLGLTAELYSPCRRWDRAIGVDFGYGGLVIFVQDSNCSNDGERVFYYFLRPQVSLGFDIGSSIGLQVSAGYNFTFPIDESELWFVNEAGDTLRNTFDADGMKGIFIKAGLVIGSLNNIKEQECRRGYKPRPRPKPKPLGRQ
ncbi:hypothetical protein J7M00_02425 [bacterium]|nr:hypothetical protein [bacterium]